MATDLQEKLNALKIDRAEPASGTPGTALKIAIAGVVVEMDAAARWRVPRPSGWSFGGSRASK